MTISRGVNGVVKTINKEYRCVNGVNKEITKQYRSIGGVNKEVFSNIYTYDVYTSVTMNTYSINYGSPSTNVGGAFTVYKDISINNTTGVMSLLGASAYYDDLQSAYDNGFYYYKDSTGAFYFLDYNERSGGYIKRKLTPVSNATYSKGNYVKTITIANKTTYPSNGRYSTDGYWYVLKQ